MITINGANDAPVALASQVVTLEDTVKTFNISEFGLSDVDDAISEAVQIRIDALPVSGDLFFNGTAVVEGQVIDAVDVSSLTFIPDLNESGSDAYIDDVGSGGLGDQQASYASFEFSVSDGALWSESATMTIDVNADADAPTLSVTMTQKSEVAITSGNVTSTTGGFTVAAYAADGTPTTISVHDTPSGFGVSGNSSGDADEIGYINGVGSEKLVISFDDSVVSVDISFAWKNQNETAQIEFYKDGIKVGETVTHKGGSDSIDPAITFQSTTGEAFDEIRCSAVGNADDYLIHEISFVKDENVGTSAITPEGTPVALHIDPSLVDTDGSESLSVTISEAPEGAVFSDGVNSVTVDSSGIADITGWNYANVTFVMSNVNADTTYQMSVNAMSTEYSNPGVTPQQLHQESVSAPLSITVSASNSGDDRLLYDGTDMDAGEGNDTLLLANNVDLDFSNVANLSNFEQIDLNANGDHQITNLTMQDVLDITDSNNELVIYGDNSDAVSLQNTAGNSWSKAPTALEENGHLFDVYTNGSATVKVEQDINDNITS